MSLDNRTITLQEAMQALDACVAERGEDYVYPEAGKRGGTCLYWWSDDKLPDTPGAASLPRGPACIVGLALFKLGVSSDHLEDGGFVNSSTLLSILERAGWSIEGGVRGLFREAQCEQDQGTAWGNAVQHAKQVAISHG